MMRRFALLIALFLLPAALAAQDRPNTILVLDASGSMWGQIDGVAKITIAQEVVTDLLQTLPANQRLGLTVYGHRTRGDCTDIETIVAPGLGTRDAIAQAVAGIRPLGKTPMTDAVIAAAQALRYTEDSATVILVSDGVETCNPDPCAAARLLEEAGINFTAHVIGFDISDAEALGQMQCIADETGGTFRTARDADELATALAVITEEPEIIVANGTFRATNGEGGPVITDQVIWTIASDSGVIAEDETGNPITLDLLEGTHRATATWVVQELTEETLFTVSGAGDVSVTIPFDIPLPLATVSGPATAAMGATMSVEWTGPNADIDRIVVAIPGERDYETHAYTKNGSPLDLQMPVVPGMYELRYVSGTNNLAVGPLFEVTQVDVSLMALDTATLGDTIDVAWVGPNYENDYVAIGRPGERSYENYTYVKAGNPVELVMPSEVGTYELRYILSQGSTGIATRPIEITPLQPQLSAPAAAQVGETIQVVWDGPDYERDYITVSEIGDDGYVNYTYTRDGTPLNLQMPSEPGDYEIHYVLNQDRQVLASIPITVTPVAVQLTAPDIAIAGATIAVGWDGPG